MHFCCSKFWLLIHVSIKPEVHTVLYKLKKARLEDVILNFRYQTMTASCDWLRQVSINISKTKSSCTSGLQNEASINQATKDGTMKPLALVEQMDELGVKAAIPNQVQFSKPIEVHL